MGHTLAHMTQLVTDFHALFFLVEAHRLHIVDRYEWTTDPSLSTSTTKRLRRSGLPVIRNDAGEYNPTSSSSIVRRTSASGAIYLMRWARQAMTSPFT